jgi:hypothetical protein
MNITSTLSDRYCECTTTWKIAFEEVYPEYVEKFHAEAHARWEEATFERHKQFANIMFDLPLDTEWKSND